MKAAVIQGNNITVEDLPDPEPAAGQLLVEPLATGICGSDLHLRQQMQELADQLPADELPRIVPGHEFVSKIVAVGTGVDPSFRPGMRVTANPFTQGKLGPECIGLSPDFSGGIATLSKVDAVRAVLVPEGIDDSLAALTEPLAVGIRAADTADRHAGPNLVIGCGPVGLAVIFALKSAGRGPVIAADFSAPRRAAAEALGADIIIDPAQDSPYNKWADVAFSESLPSPLLNEKVGKRIVAPNIFECVGAPGLLDQITKAAPQFSHIIVVGVCSHEDKLTPLIGITKELTLEFSFAYRMSQFRQALQMIETHPDRARHFVTRELPLNDTKQGFELLQRNPEEIKIIIKPQQ
jgi:threonine dehydrogenase-like Zn-dependent dehydrogenase